MNQGCWGYGRMREDQAAKPAEVWWVTGWFRNDYAQWFFFFFQSKEGALMCFKTRQIIEIRVLGQLHGVKLSRKRHAFKSVFRLFYTSSCQFGLLGILKFSFLSYSLRTISLKMAIFRIYLDAFALIELKILDRNPTMGKPYLKYFGVLIGLKHVVNTYIYICLTKFK